MKVSFERFNKAEYIFRPMQLLRRFIAQPQNAEEVCTLPWKYNLRIKVQDNIGKAVWNLGLYDLVVSETLGRLARTGPTGSVMIDAGANIGHMSSVMDCFSQEGSEVYSYEPHPLVFKQLKANIDLWPRAKTKAINKALSEKKGECDFFIPSGFKDNQGLGFIASKENEHLIETSEKLARVEMTTLDDEFLSRNIHLLKIDTEGSELLVLKGAEELLKQKKIQNIVFEDHQQYPNTLTSFLESHGFKMFHLQRGLFGPILGSVQSNKKETWEPNSFLATLNPESIDCLMGKKGWIALN